MITSIRRRAHTVGVLASLAILAGWSGVSATVQDAKAPDHKADEFVLKCQKSL